MCLFKTVLINWLFNAFEKNSGLFFYQIEHESDNQDALQESSPLAVRLPSSELLSDGESDVHSIVLPMKRKRITRVFYGDTTPPMQADGKWLLGSS